MKNNHIVLIITFAIIVLLVATGFVFGDMNFLDKLKIAFESL